VERIGSDSQGYISLIKLRDFLTGSLDKGVFDERSLISDHAIAESHGVNIELRFPHDQDIVEELDRLRLSVHYKNAQGIFNVSSWKFDMLTTFDGKEVDDRTEEEMKNLLIAHVDHFTRIKLLKSKLESSSLTGRD